MATNDAAETTAQDKAESTGANESKAIEPKDNENVPRETTQDGDDENLTEDELAEKKANDEQTKKQASERTSRRRDQRRNAKSRRETEARIDAEKKAEYWRGRAEMQTEANATQEADPKPSRDDYDDYDDFVDALTNYNIDKKFTKNEEEAPNKQPREAASEDAPDANKESRETFDAAGQEKYGNDFSDMMEAAANNEFAATSVMTEFMFNEESGIDVAMHLFDNPEESRKISALSPRGQIRALDKIAGQVFTVKTTTDKEDPDPAGKTISNAPEPINHDRGANPPKKDTLEKAAARGDMTAYSKIRSKQRKAG